MAWKSPNNWFRNWLINKFSFEGMKQRFKDNFHNGYQFGDVVKSLFGISKYDENMAPIYKYADSAAEYENRQVEELGTSNGETAAVGDGSNIGSGLNNVTGTTASQQWQTAEREASQEYNTAERVAAQDFTHYENELARQWQERMSSSALQRQMADAKAAGINPYYLFGAGNASGAGVPVASGSSGSASGGSSPQAPGSGNSASAVAGIFNALARLVGKLK